MAVVRLYVIGKKIREIHYGHHALPYILCAYKYYSVSLMNNFNPFLIYGTRNEDGARLNVMLNGEALEEVDQFKYLGSVIAANGGVEADVRHRVNEGCKVLGALKGVMKNRGLGMNGKKVLYEKVVVLTVMYGSVMGYESN